MRRKLWLCAAALARERRARRACAPCTASRCAAPRQRAGSSPRCTARTSAPRSSSTCARAPCAPRTASRTPARRPQPPPLSECSGASRRGADRRARPPRRPRGWPRRPRRRGHGASVAERGGAAQGSGAWRRPARFGGLYRDRVTVRRLGGPGSAGGAGVRGGRAGRAPGRTCRRPGCSRRSSPPACRTWGRAWCWRSASSWSRCRPGT